MLNFFKNKKIVFSLVAILAMAFGSISVSAADITPRISEYYLAEGVGDVDYYITSSASGYTTQIDNAANAWVVTGYGWNPIYMYKTTDFNASNMDIMAQNDGAYAGYNAYTMFVDVRTEGHVHIDPTQSFWDYGEIYLNTGAISGMSSEAKQGVVGHEMGHVFGLDENNDNVNSIMCQAGYGRAVYKPGKADHDGINAMY